MSKPKPIQINIANPCTQNWNEMTPAAQGRFCGQCQKTVIDFTIWSDAALYNFFSKNTGHVCGRYLISQVNRPINIPYQPHSRLYRLTIALGLSLAFAPTPHLLAQNRPPLVTQTDTSQKKKPTENQFGTISGQVFDEKKEPMINAGVQVFLNGVLVGGNVTDYDGNYSIHPLKPGNHIVLVRYAGYDSCIVKDVMVEMGQNTIRNLQMKKPSGVALKQITIKGGYRTSLINPDEMHHLTREEIMQVPTIQMGGSDGINPAQYQSQRGTDVQSNIPKADSDIITAIVNAASQRKEKSEKIKLNAEDPSKRTYTREDIEHTPH